MPKSFARLVIAWMVVASFLLSGCGSPATPGRNTSNISKNATAEHIHTLKEGSVDARRMAAHYLWQIGSEATEAAPALIDALGDKDEEVRMEAARALGAVGMNEKKTVAALVDAVKDEKAGVRIQALAALFELQEQAQPEAKIVVPALMEALKDKNEDVECGAAMVMTKFGKHCRAAVPNLMDVLKAAQPTARLYAALALAKIGAPSSPALPQLLELAQNDADIGVRVNAVIAVGYVGAEPQTTVPFLIERVKENNVAIQYAAALGLCEIGPAAKEALPVLTETLKNTADSKVREASQGAIDSLNGKRRPRSDPSLTAGRGMKGSERTKMMQMMKGPPPKQP
jgi:HEAT repeat protein